MCVQFMSFIIPLEMGGRGGYDAGCKLRIQIDHIADFTGWLFLPSNLIEEISVNN